MPTCAVIGCSKTWVRFKSKEKTRLFSLPTVITYQCKRTAELSTERRTVWLARINRIFKPGRKINGLNIRVCHRHFITGKPSALFDFTNPDWAPTLNLGYEPKKRSEASMSRYIRAQERRRKKCMLPPFLDNQQNVNDHAKNNDHALIQQVDRHFICGKPSAVCDCTDPDVAHTLHLGYKRKKPSEAAATCHNRLQEQSSENTMILPSLENQPVDVLQEFKVEFTDSSDHECQAITFPVTNENVENELQFEHHNFESLIKVEKNQHVGCQADLEHQEVVDLRSKYHDLMTRKTFLEDQEIPALRTKYLDQLRQNTLLCKQLASVSEKLCSLKKSMQELQGERDMFHKENVCLREEIGEIKRHLKHVSVDEDSLRDDDEKTSFFTGMPSFELVKRVYDFVEVGLPQSHAKTLPKFTEFVITLMRLRLGVLEQDLAYRFNVPVDAVFKICSLWIKGMSTRLEKLIVWPERSAIQRIMPPDFKAVFGDNLAVIVDCFELFVKRPETCSSHKHFSTMKFLIGITPQEKVCFVSKAWEGTASDKHIMLHSGFLNNLAPGDVVFPNRDFGEDNEVGKGSAEIAVAANNKGKTQLTSDDQKTRGMANITHRVEEMINSVKRNFRILESILPCSYLISPEGDETPPIDHVIKIICGLTNLCPSLVRDSEPNDVSVNDDHDVLRLMLSDDDVDKPIAT